VLEAPLQADDVEGGAALDSGFHGGRRLMRVHVRLYGTLGDFVAPDRRGVGFDVELNGRRSVKDLIESVGVPHCEVHVVLVDGAGVEFEHVVAGGERMAVYPHFSEIDVGALPTAGAPPPSAPRFVLDGHLGRLAAYLRAAGYDVAHDRDADDAAIARRAADEGRVVLTRDVGLLKRSLVRHGAFVRATDPRKQLDEVVRRFRIADQARPFTRCLRCNTPLVALPKEQARDRVPPRVFERFEEFVECPTCGRAFWRGTHHAALLDVMSAAVRQGEEKGERGRGEGVKT
jgi:uncharacterized protein with PIN domain